MAFLKKHWLPWLGMVCALILLVPPTGAAASSEAAYRGYQYNHKNISVPAPLSYTVKAAVKAQHLDLEFGKPFDMFIDDAGQVHILNALDGRILVMNSRLEYVSELIPKEGGVEKLIEGATGLFIRGTGKDRRLYIASPNDELVYIADSDYQILRTIAAPETDLLPENFVFKPTKVMADDDGNLYVLSQGLYLGALRFSDTFKFTGFFGSNKVQVTAKLLFDSFWKGLLSRNQSEKLARYVPIEYSNFDLSHDNFVYTVTDKLTGTGDASSGEIKKINAKSMNIFQEKNYGDLETAYDGAYLMDSTFVDVCAVDTIGVAALDSRRGRVFLYDNDSHLISVFGGLGAGKGTTSLPVAVDSIGLDVYVLDQYNETVTLYTPTEYGYKTMEAFVLYSDGRFQEGIALWESIAADNAGHPLAYTSIGKGYMALKDYNRAMGYFKAGNNTDGYSQAFEQQRKAGFKQNFTLVFIVATLLVAWLILSDYRSKARRKKYVDPVHLPDYRKVSYSLFHPGEGMESIAGTVPEGRQVKMAASIVAAWFVSSVFAWQYTGFIFSGSQNLDNFNIFIHLGKTLLLFLLWCTANWFVCTMMDGNGKLVAILSVSSVALLPYLAGLNLMTLLSNVLVQDEGIFLSIISVVTLSWSAVLLISGMKAIHEFSLPKTIGSMAGTLLGIAFLLLLGLLLWSLYLQILMFATTIVDEISFILR